MPLVLEPSWVGRRVSVRRVVERAADGRPAVRRRGRRSRRPGRADRGRRDPRRTGRGAARARPVARLAPPSTADELALRGGRRPRAARRPRPSSSAAGCCAPTTASPRRANSVLPLRQLGMPLDDALGRAARVVRRARSAAADAGAGRGPPAARRRAGRARAGPVEAEAHVMVARLGPAAASRDASGARRSRSPPPPDDGWLALYRDGSGADPQPDGRCSPATTASRSPRCASGGRTVADRPRGTWTTAGSGVIGRRGRSGRPPARAGRGGDGRAVATGARQQAPPAATCRSRPTTAAAVALYERLGLLGAPRLPLPASSPARLPLDFEPWRRHRRTTASCSSSPSTTRCARRSSCSPPPGCSATRSSSCTTPCIVRRDEDGTSHVRETTDVTPGAGRGRRGRLGPAARHPVRRPDRRARRRRRDGRRRRALRQAARHRRQGRDHRASCARPYRPGRTAVALLVSHVSVADLQRELARFPQRRARRDRHAAGRGERRPGSAAARPTGSRSPAERRRPAVSSGVAAAAGRPRDHRDRPGQRAAEQHAVGHLLACRRRRAG